MQIAGYVILIALAALFIFLIIRLPIMKKTGIPAGWRIGLFITKSIAGLAMLWLYTGYYPPETADIFLYYDDATAIYQSPEMNASHYFRIMSGTHNQDPASLKCIEEANHWYRKYKFGLYNENRSMIRFHLALLPFSFGNYYVHMLVMVFLSFLGFILILRGIQYYTNKKYLFIPVFLIPSVFFWSSGLLKEALLILPLGVAFYCATILSQTAGRRFVLNTAGLLIALVAFGLTKLYVLACFIPGIVFLLISRRKKSMFLRFLAIHLVVLLALVGLSKWAPSYSPLHIAEKKQDAFIHMVEAQGNPGGSITLTDLNPDLWDYLKNSPAALVNSLLRPGPREAEGITQYVAMLENILILIILLFAIWHHKALSRDEKAFFWFALSFSMMLFILIGLTTPNLGAISRYRVPALPFFVIMLYVFIKEKKLKIKLR